MQIVDGAVAQLRKRVRVDLRYNLIIAEAAGRAGRKP